MKTAIVIGGGVIGTACAEYLLRAGLNVTIIDRDKFGAACSGGNCGLLCPSHVLPLAEPGAVWQTAKMMLKRRSPFRVKPRFDPSLWGWFLSFARRCNRRDMLAAATGIHAMLGSATAEYDRLFTELDLECEHQTRGLLFVYRTPSKLEHFAETNALLAESFATPAKRLSGEELTEFEPALKPGLAGAWWYADDSHLRPDSLMRSWRQSLESRGVSVAEGCELLGFGDGMIRTSSGEMTADVFVLAAGALTRKFAGELGCRLPIQPGKGYSLTMPRPGICPTVPMLLMEDKVAVTPFESGYRLGSMMEFVGYDETIKAERLALLRDSAGGYLHEPTSEPVESQWYGWRPMTYDGLPIVDRSPKRPGVWVAAGHNMLGLSMAPATGRLVAELATGAEPHIDPGPYGAGRF